MIESIQVKLKLTSSDSMALPLVHPNCIKVDLGCGDRKRQSPPGFIGIDSYGYPGVDIVRDVDKHGLPFGDCTVDFIFASHFMEHVNDLIFVMEEIWRVLKRKGILEMIKPLWTSKYAYAHPDHKRLIHPDLWSWWLPSADNRDREAYGVKARFEVLKNFVQGEGLFTTLMAVK